MSDEWHKIPDSAYSLEKAMQVIEVSGREILLIQDAGNWHATSVKCPHAGANLSQGWCSQGSLVCPYHRHEFDLRTGKGSPGQYNAIRVYPVEQRSDGLFVLLSRKSKFLRWLGLCLVTA